VKKTLVSIFIVILFTACNKTQTNTTNSANKTLHKTENIRKSNSRVVSEKEIPVLIKSAKEKKYRMHGASNILLKKTEN
jgi:hypothetical protein